jgi:sugar-specific transcriptional regulator TrmB
MEGMARLTPLLLCVVLSSCTQLYYKAQEKIGNEKRDILVDRIKKGREDQEKAKEQYKDTLEAFQAATGFKGGQTEEVYKKLKKEYDEAADRTKKVSDRINSIEQVSGDMFNEWDKELSGMSNADLRTKSGGLMKATRRRYTDLIHKMKAVEAKAKPVLKAFEDQVLFIKHNLNAEAITSLKTNVLKMDADVQTLIRDIEISTKEADAFIASLPQGS